MLQKQHAGCGVASDDTAEPRTVSCEARAVDGRMARRKSVQLKAEGRGGGPPCSALERSSAMNTNASLEVPLRFQNEEVFSLEVPLRNRNLGKFFFRPRGAGERISHPPTCPPMHS